jgi:hypothetical protein
MKCCVVTFAKYSWYPRGAERLGDSLRTNGFDGDFRLFTEFTQLKCPPHSEVPYAFKPAAIAKVWDEYDLVLWCDAAITLLKPWARVLAFFKEHDWMLMLNGETAGHWCADSALEPLGISRAESFTTPNLMACVMGFVTASKKCQSFLQHYVAASKSGAFEGPWTNTHAEASVDARVRGHRHDQTAGAVIGHSLSMTPFVEHLLTYDQAEAGDERFLFLNKGGL